MEFYIQKPFEVNSSLTVKARAFRDGWSTSILDSEIYRIGDYEVVESNPLVGSHSSMVLDENDNPNISYYDEEKR